MAGNGPSLEWKRGICRVWLGHPNTANSRLIGTAFPISDKALLTAAHVAKFLVGREQDGFLSGMLFDSPQRIAAVRIPPRSESNERDFALFTISELVEIPSSNIIPILARREEWQSEGGPAWMIGFGSDPAKGLSTILTSFRANYPPNNTLIFDGHVELGTSGGPLVIGRGAIGVIIGRIPTTGEIEVVPIANMTSWLKENDVNTAGIAVPAYPDPSWGRDEKIAWVRSFSIGPPVSPSLIELTLIRAFARGYDITGAIGFLNTLNALRSRADPNLPPETVEVWDVGTPAEGKDGYFQKLLYAAAQQGPRTLAAAIVSASPAVLEGARGDIMELIEKLHRMGARPRIG